MHEIEYKILINEPLTEDIFEMVLDGDTRVPQAADQCL